MEVVENFVLLFKATSAGTSSDPYEKVLKENSFIAECLPVLDYHFINDESITENLRKPNFYSSIVFTSQRAVQAVEKSAIKMNEDWHSDLRDKWKNKLCFVVGIATSSAAQAIGFTTEGEESGNAENLVPILIKAIEGDKRPILFPCGNLKKETIPKALTENSIPFSSITVYETTADHSIKSNLQQLFNTKGIPEYMVFYSPSGVNYTYPVLLQECQCKDSIKFVAIGPTTEDALREHRITVTGTCEKPTPDSLLKLLIKLRDGV